MRIFILLLPVCTATFAEKAANEPFYDLMLTQSANATNDDSNVNSSLNILAPNKPPQFGEHVSAYHTLFNYLMNGYSKRVVPAGKNNEIIYVYFELSLLNILELNTREESLKTNSEMIFKWTDNYLLWDPEDFDGIEEIRIPSDDIWHPDIMLYNTANSDSISSIFNTNAILSFNGEVELMSKAILSSTCNIDIQWYPFDEQTCHLKFASWTYDSSHLRLLLGPADLTSFEENNEYLLEDFYGHLVVVHNPCCSLSFSAIQYSIQIQRRIKFSLYFYIMPGILINICGLLSFVVPPDTGERVSLGINALLAMIVFLMAMSSNIPPTEKIPVAGAFYGAGLIIITLGIVLSVYTLNLHFYGGEKKKVSRWIRLLSLYFAKYLYMTVPQEIIEIWDLNKGNSWDDFAEVKPFGKTKTEKTFLQNDHLPQDPSGDVLSNSPPHNDDLLKDAFEKRTVFALENVMKIMTYNHTSKKKKISRNEMMIQWKFIAKAVDRIFILAFILANILLVVFVLFMSPFSFEFTYCPLGRGHCQGMTIQERMEASHRYLDNIREKMYIPPKQKIDPSSSGSAKHKLGSGKNLAGESVDDNEFHIPIGKMMFKKK